MTQPPAPLVESGQAMAFSLKTNAIESPLGIDTPQPEFAWKLQATRDGVLQGAYRLQVAREAGFQECVWDSDKVTSHDQFGILYAGVPLASRQRYHWRVCLWDEDNLPGAWSTASWFETAMLVPSDWTAHWISAEAPPAEGDKAARYFRAVLDLPAKVVRARAYVSALGWYRFFVNGQDLTGPALVPRWTPFDHLVEYQTYDVTEALCAGSNVLGIVVADGRFRGRLGGLVPQTPRYGDRHAAIAQLHVDLEDGRTLCFSTDTNWTVGPGRILYSDPKGGEQVDLRLPEHDWSCELAEPAGFQPSCRLAPSQRRLIAEELGRVRAIDRLPAQRIGKTASGKQIVDFGQNFAGVARVRLRGPAGQRVRLTFSELLTVDGELDTHYLDVPFMKHPVQCDQVILGEKEAWFQPWFTVHGFRYMEVDGLQLALEPQDVEGVVISSDLAVVGSFDCSDKSLNQLHRNVFWSLRSNFMDTSTDCPTRERSGWTGDIQVFAATATTLVDAQAYLRRYLRNLALEQHPDGRIPPFIPSETSAFSGPPSGVLGKFSISAGWGDASVLVPLSLHRYYGDRIVLSRQFDSMKRWVDFLAGLAQSTRRRFAALRGDEDWRRFVVEGGFHFGEWLRPGEVVGPLAMLKSLLFPSAVVATAYLAHSSRLLSEAAATLGLQDDAFRYAKLSAQVRDAWLRAFVREDGRRIGEDKQDDYVRALAFDLLPPEQQPHALQRLIELIEAAGDHLGTGFLSTPMLLSTLATRGRQDVAYRLLLQRSSPSWLYPIEHGATTIWETWEGHRKNGKAHGSRNHYALGAVAAWLVQGIAGLTPSAPGYRRIGIAPCVGGGLTHASATVETPFGLAKSGWRVLGGTVLLQITVPPGTRASVRLGDGTTHDVGSGEHVFEWAVPESE